MVVVVVVVVVGVSVSLPRSETRIPRRHTEGELLRLSLITTGADEDCSPSLPPSPASLLHGAVVMVVVVVKVVVVVLVVVVMMVVEVVEVLEVMVAAEWGGGGPTSPGFTPAAAGVRSMHATSQPPPPTLHLYTHTSTTACTSQRSLHIYISMKKS